MNTKRLAIATSILLVAISGQACARTAHAAEKHWMNAVGSTSEVQSPENGNDLAVLPSQMTGANMHRYTGGPKSND